MTQSHCCFLSNCKTAYITLTVDISKINITNDENWYIFIGSSSYLPQLHYNPTKHTASQLHPWLGNQQRFGSMHLVAPSVECLLVAPASAFHYTLPTCQVSTSDLLYFQNRNVGSQVFHSWHCSDNKLEPLTLKRDEHQPPTIPYLQAKFQLQNCCSSWDIAWQRNRYQVITQLVTQLAEFDIAEPKHAWNAGHLHDTAQQTRRGKG